jgi:HSP20 family protein
MLAKSYDSILTRGILDSFLYFDDLYGRKTVDLTESRYRVETTDKDLTLSIDLPGVKVSDLSVKAVGQEVKVGGKIRGEEFKYSYRLSKDYDSDATSATLEDGVLTLRFSKTRKEEAKTIEVKVK